MPWSEKPKPPVAPLSQDQAEYLGALALLSWKGARDLSVRRGLRDSVKTAVLADVQFSADVLKALGYAWKD
jgi:hypothetical protein